MLDDKNIYKDMLFGWLVSNSDYNSTEQCHYILKEKASYNGISKALGISRPSATSRMKALVADGTVEEVGNYYKIKVPMDNYFVAEAGVLNFLLARFNEMVVKIYIMIGVALHEQELDNGVLKMWQITKYFGLPASDVQVNKMYSCLLVLNMCGLLDWEEEEYVDGLHLTITVFNTKLETKRKLEQEK